MNYEIIFDDITRTIRKDYAGAAEIKRPEDAHDFSNQLASAYKAKKLDNVFFLRIMNQYLGTLGDKNLKLELRESDDYKQTDRGLTVRLMKRYRAPMIIATDDVSPMVPEWVPMTIERRSTVSPVFASASGVAPDTASFRIG